MAVTPTYGGETTNYKMAKPALTDAADIGIVNADMDIIDDELKTLSDTNASIVSTIKTIHKSASIPNSYPSEGFLGAIKSIAKYIYDEIPDVTDLIAVNGTFRIIPGTYAVCTGTFVRTGLAAIVLGSDGTTGTAYVRYDGGTAFTGHILADGDMSSPIVDIDSANVSSSDSWCKKLGKLYVLSVDATIASGTHSGWTQIAKIQNASIPRNIFASLRTFNTASAGTASQCSKVGNDVIVTAYAPTAGTRYVGQFIWIDM